MQKEKKDIRHMIEYMRDLGRKKIIERVNAFKNNEHLPDDILTSILNSYSNNNKLLFYKCDKN